MMTKNTLLIIIAYLLMIIIWSTTPLAIKWSSQGVSFITGVSLRMLIGAGLASILSIIWYRSIPMHKSARQVYLASAAAIYGAMMMVYWGAQFIPSGLISVLFGLTPILTAGFAFYLLNNETFGLNKLIGALLGILGLIIIFIDQIELGEQAMLGIAAVLVSVLLHSGSAVWIKRLNVSLPALIVTTGGLLYSMPLFIVSFLLFADPFPEQLPSRTLWSIVYLGVMGSVIGFVSYYFVLAKLSPSTVALATLITPVSALLLGTWFNQETINVSIFIGTACIMSGLIIHQFYDLLKKKIIHKIA
ncbi:MAG: DMT family transporter [gamma proteobacterium symbiont of Bathyaustriella thionipta]|nr:DMT family transporter [gamma proteobacterium symbiont of Bathyaustriella thionipta]MCU7951227.1 DMT family transporter [gamma proteobacterium symbiont of Bathyaustriella thionipta]MCU7952404.1 DMT family transporter [gamma proteobacterium symbiont of Bathyaustriella thionipta]MCU7957752.1 DMT family transporter [gamma proteobacterium symbiont of Bathyaustriella thionipta]MCU7966041.1 DMT family transporter [gamma proteobacterium symbiont of Bathyaustriella thionipta]